MNSGEEMKTCWKCKQEGEFYQYQLCKNCLLIEFQELKLRLIKSKKGKNNV